LLQWNVMSQWWGATRVGAACLRGCCRRRTIEVPVGGDVEVGGATEAAENEEAAAAVGPAPGQVLCSRCRAEVELEEVESRAGSEASEETVREVLQAVVVESLPAFRPPTLWEAVRAPWSWQVKGQPKATRR